MGKNSDARSRSRDLEDIFPGAWCIAAFITDALADSCKLLTFTKNQCVLVVETSDEEAYTITIERGNTTGAPMKLDPPWTPFERGMPIKGSDVPGVNTNKVWLNSRYQVFVYDGPEPTEGEPRIIHLSIKRHDRGPIRDWRDMQRIKNELSGTATEAVELYPAESRLADTANQYHLWCVEPGVHFPFGFNDGRLTNDTPESRKYLDDQLRKNGHDPNNLKTKQRKWEKHHRANGLPERGPIWNSKSDSKTNEDADEKTGQSNEEITLI